MALRDTIRANAAHLINPGEEIEEVIAGQTTSPYLSLISIWIVIIADAFRVIVVTDQRILVCRTGRFRISPVKGVLRELPRQTKIGSPSGLWHRTDSLGERIFIHKRFFADIRRADGSPPTTAS